MSQDKPALFIDGGVVMNENVARAAEWRRLVAEFFQPLMGGDASTWEEANRITFARLESYLVHGPQGEQEFVQWYDTYRLRWLRGMAEFAGVACPLDDAACLELAIKAGDYITQRVESAFPGAADAIRVPHSAGFKLFTASEEHWRELDGYTRAMGVRECFRASYGSDLINQGKYSVDYYPRLFGHAA